MKVLITGSSGFIGRHLTKSLKNKGFDIIATSRNQKNHNSDIKFIQADLSKQFNYNESVDVIIHTAGKFWENGENLNKFMLSNYETTKNIVEYALRNEVKKIIYLSSIRVYGDINNSVLTEETPIINQNYYGLSKYLSECLLKDSKEIDCISLRLPGVIGDNDVTATPWIMKVAEKMLKNDDIEYYNPQSYFNNILHLLDLEKFIIKLIDSNFNGFNVLNLGCTENIKIIDMLEFLKSELNSKSKLIAKNDLNRKSFTISLEKALIYGYKSMSMNENIKKVLKGRF